MANSKSNIYPIQLQGAELNLNKLDAEIKQYSGFNKNNSPFVGGCLSNVFHKEEQISGGNAENTFIDTNGDVYEVTDHALLKNGGQVLSFQEDKYFVQNELKFNDNPVKVISDKLYVVEEVNIDGSHSYYLKSKEGVFTVGENEVEKLLLTTTSDGNNEDFQIIPKNCITAIFLTQSEKVYCFVAGYSANSNGVNNLWCIDIDTQDAFYHDIEAVSSTQVVTKTIPIAICYDETSGQISVYRASKSSGSNTSSAAFSFFTVNYENKTFTFIENASTISNSGLSSDQKYISNNISFYRCLNYPINKVVPVFKSVSEYTSDNTAFKCFGLLETPYYEDAYIKFRNKELISKYKGIKFLIGLFEESQLKGTVSPFLLSVDLQLGARDDTESTTPEGYYIVHFNSEKALLFQEGLDATVSDFQISNSTSVKRYQYIMGDFVSLGTVFKLAVNNNEFSAICGENVLLTEWNSIDIKELMFYSDHRDSKKINTNYDERIYYKCNGKFYEIRLAEKPRLQKFENQIVVNADSMSNSYDINKNVPLHFASCFNSFDMSSFYIPAGNMPLRPLDPTPTEKYTGFAVNEYKQENNSSIILNPINSNLGEKFFYSGVFPVPNSFDDINIYYTLSGSKITYLRTIKRRYYSDGGYWTVDIKINNDLLELPFPIDTNGNVEYNVNLFSKIKSVYGNYAFISSGLNSYPLVVGNNNNVLMNYYLASGIENLEEMFIIQGQFYGIIGNNLFSLSFNNGVVGGVQFIVDVSNLQFVGNTPYEALFFSKTNRCLYSFTGVNVLNQKQLVDKISEVRNYLYNPATQTVFLITDIGVLFYGLFGMFLLEYTDITNIFLLDNGIVMSDNSGNYRYIKYYLDEGDEGYTKENIRLETCFYGMNNEVVTINDCLYFRLFSEEHEEGDLKVKATTISLKGRQTEETTFKIKASDWDAITHTIYLRYQPKTQRGLGVSFSIDSPFKIASMSVGSQPDAVLVDRVSKGAITAPSVTTNNNEW